MLKSLPKNKRFRRLITSSTVLIFIISLISCAQKRDNSRIIVSSKGKIESIDPAQANKLLAIQLISSLGDTLYEINSKGVLEPKLAKTLPKVSKNGLTLLIPLREDVLFHDGTRFDAYAMAFSLNRFIEIGTLNYVISDRIKSIETPEKFLLRINLRRPSSSIKGLLTSINLTPVSPTSYSENHKTFKNNTFIGTGPYKLTSFTPEGLSLDPFENYWDKKVANQGIDYINYKTSLSLFSAIKSGQVDVLLSNSIEDGHRLALNKLSQRGVLNEGIGPAMQIGYIALRSNNLPLSNKTLRKAISYSINRNLITEKVSYGLREPLRSIVPPILKEEQISPWPEYNPKYAKELFKQSNYCEDERLSIPITFRSNVPADKLLALTWQEQVKRDLSECLILELNGVESTTIYKRLAEGAFEAVILGWTGDYPDPEAYLSPLLECSKIDGEVCKEGEAVYGGTFWATPEIQSALKKGESLTGTERTKILKKVEILAAEGSAIIPIWLVKPRVWTQADFNYPEFDGSGRLLLEKLKRNLNE